MSFKGIPFEIIDQLDVGNQEVLLLKDEDLFIRVIQKKSGEYLDFHKGDVIFLCQDSYGKQSLFIREIVKFDGMYLYFKEIQGGKISNVIRILPIFNLATFSKISGSLEDAQNMLEAMT